MTEQQMINFWKANEKPFGLCPKEAQEWLKKHESLPLELWDLDGWHAAAKYYLAVINRTDLVRLHPDYQSKPVGRWVECEVYPSGNSFAYYFKFKGECIPLYEAPGMVGFGGVEYEVWGWENVLGAITKDGKLCRPIRVKLWEEALKR